MSNPSKLTRAGMVLSVLTVGGVAAVISFAHLQELAARSGEGWRSALLPLAVDGMLVGATLAMVDARRRRQRAGWAPWVGLTAGVLASLAGNVAAAHPDLIARMVAGWAPAALFISIETLVGVLRRTDHPPAHQSTPAVPDALAPAQPPAESPVAPARERPARTRPPKRQHRAPAPGPERVAELAGNGMGRRAIARETGLSEHAVRQALAARNGHAPPALTH